VSVAAQDTERAQLEHVRWRGDFGRVLFTDGYEIAVSVRESADKQDRGRFEELEMEMVTMPPGSALLRPDQAMARVGENCEHILESWREHVARER
jgi:hypothetical protein